MTLLDASTNTFEFDMNGVDLIGTYHAGPPPADLDTSPDAIVITAPHISGSTTTDTTDPTGYFFFDPNESGLNFNDGFGGGGGSSPQVTIPSYATMSSALAALHKLTDSSKDIDSKEHFAIVYKDANGYHISPVFVGTGLQGDLSPLFNWMSANGVPYSEVTDFYHNHDSDSYGTSTEEEEVNRYPSSPTTGGKDWSVADYFISKGADPTIFTLSIEDTAHDVRDFSYSLKSTYVALSPQQMEDGSHLPPTAH